MAVSICSAQSVHEEEDTRQPGTVLFAAIAKTDTVFLDGERVGTGRSLDRYGRELLVAPGTYVVTVVSAGTTNVCNTRILVRAREITVPQCGHREPQVTD
jgi:hypothetical protein